MSTRDLIYTRRDLFLDTYFNYIIHINLSYTYNNIKYKIEMYENIYFIYLKHV
jgi:hypothetical protein